MALQLLAANNASTLLVSGISAASTTLQVSTGTGDLFPSPVPGTSYFKVTLTSLAAGKTKEVVHVTARSGDTLTITRGQEGTAAASWDSGASVANLFTAGTFNDLAQQMDIDQIYTDLASTSAGKGTELIFNKSPLAGAVARSQHDKNSDFRTLEDFGAIGDGINHPLSERFSTLTAAQMVYSFVTSLTQSIDWAAATAAGNAGGFSMLGKKYSLSQTLNITGKTSIQGLGDGLSDFIFTGTGDGIVITLQNDKDSKFWLRDFGILRTGTPSSTTKETALKIDGRAQILIPGTSTSLAQLGYRTEFRGAIENIRIAGNDVTTGGWFRGINLISVMNFRIQGFAYCGYVQSSGVFLGEAITVGGDGYVVDFSISRVWIFYCNTALNFPDYVEGVHVYDFEMMNINNGMVGGIVQPETVVPSLTGQITSPGVLSPWVHNGHMNCTNESILMPANCNLAKFHDLHLFCSPLSTDTQGRSAISLSYGAGAQISNIYVLMDRAANTAYLDSNSGIFLGNMVGCQVNNINVGGVSNRGNAITISGGTTRCSFDEILTNTKYGITGIGSTPNNNFGRVAPGFGTARFNITDRYNNSFNYETVSRTDTITLTGPVGGGAAENYFDITPISTLSEVPSEVYVGLAYSDAPSAQAYYDFDGSTVNRIRIRVRATSIPAGAKVFRTFVQYPLT